MNQRSRSTKSAGRQTVMAAGAGQGHSAGHLPAAPAGDPSQTDSDGFESCDQVAMVRRAADVLGIDHVARWMRSGIPSLGNQAPYALIKTQDGRDQVERVLMKIEHGVY